MNKENLIKPSSHPENMHRVYYDPGVALTVPGLYIQISMGWRETGFLELSLERWRRQYKNNGNRHCVLWIYFRFGARGGHPPSMHLDPRLPAERTDRVYMIHGLHINSCELIKSPTNAECRCTMLVYNANNDQNITYSKMLLGLAQTPMLSRSISSSFATNLPSLLKTDLIACL